jgi:hypothetical protein
MFVCSLNGWIVGAAKQHRQQLDDKRGNSDNSREHALVLDEDAEEGVEVNQLQRLRYGEREGNEGRRGGDPVLAEARY